MSISGNDLSNNLYDQIINLGVDFELEKVIKVEDKKDKKIVTTEYNTYETKSIIIATGCKHRPLGIKNEETFIGKGISYCVLCDGAFYKEKDVAVIGGGNTAVVSAIYLSEIVNKIYIIQMLDKLTAEEKLIEKINKIKNIEYVFNSKVDKLNGDDLLESITVGDKTIKLDGVFVSIGLLPQNDMFKDLIKLDKYGYIDSDESCRTNVEGIFVAGDCRSKKVRQITTASSDGTTASINACNYVDNI
jgi:thioredoxin reductase (NADPH)